MESQGYDSPNVEMGALCSEGTKKTKEKYTSLLVYGFVLWMCKSLCVEKEIWKNGRCEFKKENVLS